MSTITIGPQPGPQTMFMETPADIALYGGAAGGGKTFSLLMCPLRHYLMSAFKGVIFKREATSIRMAGGIWDQSKNLYYLVDGRPTGNSLKWLFPSGMQTQFSHLFKADDVYNWQGTELPFIGFDELTHFLEHQFFYMLSRNRSTTGIEGYIRATCNPDADSWVADFIEWWIDQETGLIIPERSGKVRYFVRPDNQDHLVWADNKEDFLEAFDKETAERAKSVTFISANIYDNQILMQKDPSYLKNLQSLPNVDRQRLLGGNWKIKASAGLIYKEHWFEVIDTPPPDTAFKKIVRCWDKASTDMKKALAKNDGKKVDPDWTVGLKMGVTHDGKFVVLDIQRERLGPFDVERLVLNTAKKDGRKCVVKLFQDPGSAGVHEAKSYQKLLSGFIVVVEKIIVDKVTNSKPSSSSAQGGFISILRADWNKPFFHETTRFPQKGGHDDIVDGLTGAYNYLSEENSGRFTDELGQHSDTQKMQYLDLNRDILGRDSKW